MPKATACSQGTSVFTSPPFPSRHANSSPSSVSDTDHSSPSDDISHPWGLPGGSSTHAIRPRMSVIPMADMRMPVPATARDMDGESN